MRKAVVDVGSNSVLLLVEEHDGEKWRPVHEATWVTSLGAGTRETGLLSEKGMTDTLAALREAFACGEEYGVIETIAAATMAARIAKNSHVFLHLANTQHTPVFVLSGDSEAELGFQAVAYDAAFCDKERLSIVDVGGQSTELVIADRAGDEWAVRFRRSFEIGTLALRGGVLRDEAPDAGAVLEASGIVDDLVGVSYRGDGGGYPVTIGATGTNLVSIREKMTSWDPSRVHGAWLDYEEISKAAGWMMRMTDAERAAIVGMERGREKTLHIGALILERFLHAIHGPGCAVSVRGWRHALLERGLAP